MPSLDLQKEAESKWQDLPTILLGRIRSWRFNLIICALHELQNEGVIMRYEIRDQIESAFYVKCVPFRGYSKVFLVLPDQEQVNFVGSDFP